MPTKVIDLKDAIKSTDAINNLIDDLIYNNYVYNRQRTPDITPEQWKVVYGDTTKYEQRYQATGETR